LNALQEQYASDLVVLGFPCNQFAYQEPGANATEVYNSLANVRPGGGFVPAFPLFKKIDVNGPLAADWYKFLKEACPSPNEAFQTKLRLMYDGMSNSDVRWNFEKFLVDQEGVPYMRFEPQFLPANIAPHIEELIAMKKTRQSSSTGGRVSSPLRRL
jgi:glutathione peroxidase